jgi:hypothetical protein
MIKTDIWILKGTRFMKTYEIKRFTSWENIPTLDINIPYLDTPSHTTAKAQISWDDEAILVHLSTCEPVTRAEEVGELASPCYDSCLEFFFRPIEDDMRYFNIEFNSIGTIFFGFGTGDDTLTRLIVEKDKIFNPDIRKYDGGWEIYYRIPYSYIRVYFPEFRVYGGKIMYANCYKCADFSEPPHYLSWNEVDREHFTFHNPPLFGKMVFVEK